MRDPEETYGRAPELDGPVHGGGQEDVAEGLQLVGLVGVAGHGEDGGFMEVEGLCDRELVRAGLNGVEHAVVAANVEGGGVHIRHRHRGDADELGGSGVLLLVHQQGGGCIRSSTGGR